jgi:Fungal Zn(2)-Cys(6) binuclear cluster domain
MPPHDRLVRHLSDASTSSTLTLLTVRSASTDPWSTSGFVEDEPIMDRSGDELEDSDSLVELKLELADDDVQMDDLQEASSMSTPTPGDSKPELRARRPRGRPRKHPVQTSEVATKVQKGRSKTGCITCRRRKKKCDETKPTCELPFLVVSVQTQALKADKYRLEL